MSHVKIEDLNVERTLEEAELAGIVGSGTPHYRPLGHGSSYGSSYGRSYGAWGVSRSHGNRYPTYRHGGYYGGHRGGYGSYYGNRHGGIQINVGHGYGYGGYGSH